MKYEKGYLISGLPQISPPIKAKITASSFVLPEISISFPYTYVLLTILAGLFVRVSVENHSYFGGTCTHTLTHELLPTKLCEFLPTVESEKSYIKPHCFGSNCNL